MFRMLTIRILLLMKHHRFSKSVYSQYTQIRSGSYIYNTLSLSMCDRRNYDYDNLSWSQHELCIRQNEVFIISNSFRSNNWHTIVYILATSKATR